MEFGLNLNKRKIETNVGKTSDRVGDLIDDGITEKAFKSTIKNPKIKI